MERRSVEQRAVLIFAKNGGQFRRKQLKFFEFLKHVTLPTAFLKFYAFSTNALKGSIC